METSHVAFIAINSEFWSRHSNKNLRRQNNEDFFIQLLYAWLHLTNNNLPAPSSIEEILDKTIFLNLPTRLDFKHTAQEYFRQIYHY